MVPGDAMAVWLNEKLASGGRPETYPLRLPLSLRGRLSLVRAGLKIRRAVPDYLTGQPTVRREPGRRRTRVLAYRATIRRSLTFWVRCIPT